jgi:hypothetical protein
MKSGEPRREPRERIAVFDAILAGKGFTRYSIAKKTKELYGESSPYCIDSTFANDVFVRLASPHICQIVALSRLTRYSVVSWLEFVDLPPEMISRWQVRLHRDQTTLLPSVTYDKHSLIPFLGTRINPSDLDWTVPFSRIAKYTDALSIGSVEPLNRKAFLYARIGKQDTFAFPDLVPESVVRVDPANITLETGFSVAEHQGPLYLVEYPGGITCCHVKRLDQQRILLAPHLVDFEHLTLRLHTEANILGTVNAEVRPMLASVKPTRRPIRGAFRVIDVGDDLARRLSAGELLRHARTRLRLSIRDVHQMSLQLVSELENRQFLLSTGLLGELENGGHPRHIEKIISVCIIYSLDLWIYLGALGTSLEGTGTEAIPLQHRIVIPSADQEVKSNEPLSGLNLARLLSDRLGEIPLFFRHSFPYQVDGREVTSRDLYWFGQREKVFHPLLQGAILLAIDSTRMHHMTATTWQDPSLRPLFLALQRDGRYACGFAALNRNAVTIEPHPDCPAEPIRFVNGLQAEVLGRVVALARVFQ